MSLFCCSRLGAAAGVPGAAVEAAPGVRGALPLGVAGTAPEPPGVLGALRAALPPGVLGAGVRGAALLHAAGVLGAAFLAWTLAAAGVFGAGAGDPLDAEEVEDSLLLESSSSKGE